MFIRMVLVLAMMFAHLIMPSEQKAVKKGELFVLATLYRRHEKVAVYDLATLRRIIETINPEVLVLDVTPTELKEGKVHASKIEYTEVIFPMINSGSYRVYPAEPPEPMFSEIVNEVLKKINDLKTSNPSADTVMEQMSKSTYEALVEYWHTPADVNSSVTDRVLRGKMALDDRLLGLDPDDQRWNQHTIDITLRAIRENPGKRVLLLAGIENCGVIRETIGRKTNIIDIEKWLRTHEKSFLQAK